MSIIDKIFIILIVVAIPVYAYLLAIGWTWGQLTIIKRLKRKDKQNGKTNDGKEE